MSDPLDRYSSRAQKYHNHLVYLHDLERRIDENRGWKWLGQIITYRWVLIKDIVARWG